LETWYVFAMTGLTRRRSVNQATATEAQQRGAGTRRRWSRRLACLAVLLVGGCLSPTLPLPPPNRPEVEQLSQALVQVRGRVPEPAAPVLALNTNSGRYAGDTADDRGEFEFEIAARRGDVLELWYEARGRRSASVVVVIGSGLDANGGGAGGLEAVGGAAGAAPELDATSRGGAGLGGAR
jgi:hypothetical protein